MSGWLLASPAKGREEVNEVSHTMIESFDISAEAGGGSCIGGRPTDYPESNTPPTPPSKVVEELVLHDVGDDLCYLDDYSIENHVPPSVVLTSKSACASKASPRIPLAPCAVPAKHANHMKPNVNDPVDKEVASDPAPRVPASASVSSLTLSGACDVEERENEELGEAPAVLETLLETLSSGSSPASPASLASAATTHTLRARLRRFYEVYNPEKVGSVDQIALDYTGQEERLYALLEAKYGLGAEASQALREGKSPHKRNSLLRRIWNKGKSRRT